MREGIDNTGDIIQSGTTGYIRIASGTTAQRPTSPVNGMMRWNTTLSGWDLYDNGNWTTHRYDTILDENSSQSEVKHFVYDTTRSQFMASETIQTVYQATSPTTNDYVYPSATTLSSDVGIYMPYAGTIIGFSAYMSNTNRCQRALSVYVDTVENTNVFVMGVSNTTGLWANSVNTTGINFNAGQSIRLQLRFTAGTSGNHWTNLQLMMYHKWRI